MQFMQMMQLQDVMESQSKKLTLHINIEDITQDFIAQYQNLLQKHKGKQPICFVVHSDKGNVHLNMENPQLRVAITKEFLDELDALLAKYHLNDRRIERIIAKRVEETHEETEEMIMEELGLSD